MLRYNNELSVLLFSTRLYLISAKFSRVRLDEAFSTSNNASSSSPAATTETVVSFDGSRAQCIYKMISTQHFVAFSLKDVLCVLYICVCVQCTRPRGRVKRNNGI